MVRYCHYNANMVSDDHAALCDHNREHGDLVARAEYSGSEGCYTEVARWSYKRDRWERFCFCKFLGGEDLAHADWPPQKLAEHHAHEINAAANPTQSLLPLIYRLPDRPKEETAL